MTDKPKILAIAGSLREHSYNKRIVRIAMQGAEMAGAEVTYVDLRDYPMPIYNSDNEKNGFDPNALAFQGIVTDHDGFLIASPEYNGSLSAALKNAIDWASRQSNVYDRSKIFRGKFAAIMSAAPGPFGGLRSLLHLRGVLTSLGVNVLPAEVAVPLVSDKFEGEEMKDETVNTALENLGVSLAEILTLTRRETSDLRVLSLAK